MIRNSVSDFSINAALTDRYFIDENTLLCLLSSLLKINDPRVHVFSSARYQRRPIKMNRQISITFFQFSRVRCDRSRKFFLTVVRAFFFLFLFSCISTLPHRLPLITYRKLMLLSSKMSMESKLVTRYE